MNEKTLKTAFSRGFTLIELMIVIVILGVLMGTILPRITGVQSKAADVAIKADMNVISQALESYYADNGRYPANATAGTAQCLSAITTQIGKYMKGGVTPTPKKAPTAAIYGANCVATTTPAYPGDYVYLATTDGYAVFANLNNSDEYNIAAPATAPTAQPDTGAIVTLVQNATDTDNAYVVTN